MDAPCTAKEALIRAQAMVIARTGEYQYGTGDYRGTSDPSNDYPWTGTPPGSDCAGFAICYAWKLRRHRPGFNAGSWASVSDDINCNSAIEDAAHRAELFTVAPPYQSPRPGDLITYPTFELKDDHGNYFRNADGSVKHWIGHVAIIESVPADYKPGEGWHRLTLIQCHGPNGFKPGVVRTDGSVFDTHDHNWPEPEHRSRIIRPRER